MIIDPNRSVNMQSLETLPEKTDKAMMKTAIILERESQDIAPVFMLGVPAAALLTFYAKNDAFIPSAADKQSVRILKAACNKTADAIYSTSGKGVKATLFSCWRGFNWTKAQAKVTFDELKEIISPQIKRLGHALRDDARNVFRTIVR